ncbi:MAG: hypothetical protein IKQ92_14340 [Clostridia bacterium]|nr:hypothetical protein [Clostridia bacterium]
MNGYERTVKFVRGEPVDRPPFMPLAIEWIAREQGIPYPEFVYEPEKRVRAYSSAAKKYDIDCVLPDADFYEQLEDFGAKPVFDGKAFSAAPIIEDVTELSHLSLPEYAPGTREGNRLAVLRALADEFKGEKYIFGITVGPFTEFCNARGVEDALCDLMDNADAVAEAMRIFFENGMRFIDAQLEAGAEGIQIVEPCCSLIPPALYEEHVLPLHRKMIERVQRGRDDGFARLHICGDTNRLLPVLLGTGTRILDVDYQVDVEAGAKLLAPGQVFCGNLSPASDVLNGKPEDFAEKVRRIDEATGRRIIISAGCDIPPATTVENMIAFHDAAANLA